MKVARLPNGDFISEDLSVDLAHKRNINTLFQPKADRKTRGNQYAEVTSSYS